MGRLDGKVAIVTGGASGMGAASAKLFAREGARVVIVDKNVDGGRAVLREIRESGGEATFVEADVSNTEAAKRAVDETIKAYDGLDILFNNAGVTTTVPLHEMTEEEFDEVIGANLKSVFFLSKYAVIEMRKRGGGVILTNSSKGAIVASDCSPIYAASKAASMQLMQATAVAYAKENIRANSLLPGIIDTPMSDLWLSRQPDPAASLEMCENAQPMGRRGTPEECANAALFLVSDDAAFITGTYLLVDGGYCAQ